MDLIVRHGEREEEVSLERTEEGYRVRVGEASYEVDVAALGGDGRSLVVDGRQYEVSVHARNQGHYTVSDPRGEHEVQVMDPLTRLAQAAHGDRAASGERVCAYMPGRVVKVLAAEGDEVEAGQGVVVLEAMKMENEIQSEHAGVVKKVFVEEGQAVDGGDPLFEID